jgi:adenosylcobinamide-GDP ribazoletransferase
MRGFAVAVGFLTRVPVRVRVRGPAELAPSVPWFPVVGGLVGAAAGAVYVGAALALPPLAAASVAVGAEVLLTGAFHEDGLGDTADGLVGAHGGRDALRIMRDPRLGSFGVVAVVLALVARVAAVGSLAGWAAVAALGAAGGLSRAAAAVVVGSNPVASEQGLGVSYAGELRRGQVTAAAVVGAGLGAALLGPWAAAAILVPTPGILGIVWLARRRIGGITGDVLGAVQQVALVGALLTAAAVVRAGWALPPW